MSDGAGAGGRLIVRHANGIAPTAQSGGGSMRCGRPQAVSLASMTRLVVMSALFLGLWAGNAAASTNRITAAPNPATAREPVTVTATWRIDSNSHVRVYEERGGTACDSTLARQEQHSNPVFADSAPGPATGSSSDSFTPAAAEPHLLCGYVYDSTYTVTATAAATLSVLEAAAAPTLVAEATQKLTPFAGIAVQATFPRLCTYTARGTATVGSHTYSFTVKGGGAGGKGTVARAGTITIRLAPSASDYTKLRAALAAGRGAGVAVTVTAKYASSRYAASSAITLR